MSIRNISLSGPIRSEMTTAELARSNRLATQAAARFEAQRDGRADAFGLILRERFDDSGRKIREWDSVTGRKGWMEPFKQHITHEQVCIWNRVSSEDERQVMEANYRQARGI